MITQFGAERNNSKAGYKPVAITMQSSDTVLAAWKSGDAAIFVAHYALVSGKWEATTTEVSNVYRQLATN